MHELNDGEAVLGELGSGVLLALDPEDGLSGEVPLGSTGHVLHRVVPPQLLLQFPHEAVRHHVRHCLRCDQVWFRPPFFLSLLVSLYSETLALYYHVASLLHAHGKRVHLSRLFCSRAPKLAIKAAQLRRQGLGE